MSFDNDDELNIAEISCFLQDTLLMDSEFGFDSVDLEDMFNEEEVGELYLPPDNDLKDNHITSVEGCEYFPAVDISNAGIDSSDDEFLKKTMTKSIFHEKYKKPVPSYTPESVLKRPDLVTSMPYSKRSSQKVSDPEGTEDSKQKIKFQFNINNTLENLIQTMKKTEHTRHLLALTRSAKSSKDIRRTLGKQRFHRRNSVDSPLLTIFNHIPDPLPNEVHPIANAMEIRNQYMDLSTSTSKIKKSNALMKACRRISIGKPSVYKNRRSSLKF